MGRIFDWEGWVVPMWHPALGLHKTFKMREILEDWEKLGEWLKTGEWQWAVDIVGDRYYTRAESPTVVNEYFRYTVVRTFLEYIAVDSETHGNCPFSLQVSREVGTGLLVLETDLEAMRRLMSILKNHIRDGTEIVMHNAPADIDRLTYHLRLFGMNEFPFRDTMVEAYNLGLPQALKTLSRRLLGRTRKSWDETVTPPSKEALTYWLGQAIILSQENRTEYVKRVSPKTGKELKPKAVKSHLESALSSLLTHTLNSPDYDPWDKLKERVSAEDLVWLKEANGEIPVKGIGHCSEEELVEYGCSDADDTLAIALMFEEMRRDKKLEVEEVDNDRL
jgi:hypothetical protein